MQKTQKAILMKWKGTRKHKRAAMMMDLLVSGELFGDAGHEAGKKCCRLCEEKATSMENLHGQRHTAYFLFESTTY